MCKIYSYNESLLNNQLFTIDKKIFLYKVLVEKNIVTTSDVMLHLIKDVLK